MRLPEEFVKNMRNLLGETEFKEFINSYDERKYQGLRINPLKITPEMFEKISPFKIDNIPWCKCGYYYENTDYSEAPSHHPYYYAGLYYLQEPSAMLPAEVLNAQPGEKILDLCAAPGGKTTQIAASMHGEGILVVNDINSQRIKPLIKNLEMFGVRNAVVLNENPENMAENFSQYFDKILIDAPCSGEGMFRKDDEAVRRWEEYKSDKCSSMQKNILTAADKMLRPGGCIVYSTCTFNPDENERIIQWFINNKPEYTITDITKCGGISDGKAEWQSDGLNKIDDIQKTARLWPHKLKGEGHFTAKLIKNNSSEQQTKLNTGNEFKKYENIEDKVLPKELTDFFKNTCTDEYCSEMRGNILSVGGNCYTLNEKIPSLSGLKVCKFGFYLGKAEKGRFEPSHSLALASRKEDFINAVNLSSKSSEIIKYLKCETIDADANNGMNCVLVDGFPLGWGKVANCSMKNLYPKGWRKL